MGTLPERVRANTEAVAAKVIDGEAIIMNVRSGVYYSMEGVGAFIWSLIEAGEGLDDVLAAVVGGYDVEADRARRDLAGLVTKLLEEQIVVSAAGPAAPRSPAAAERREQRGPYREPELAIYRDMGDLLALDPPAPSVTDLRWKE